MTQAKNLKPLMPGVSYAFYPASARTDYTFYVKLELQNHTFFFEVLNRDVKKLQIKLYDMPFGIQSPITKYGDFTSFEVREILQDFLLKETTQYFPKSFDDLELSIEELNKLQAILSLSLCFL